MTLIKRFSKTIGLFLYNTFNTKAVVYISFIYSYFAFHILITNFASSQYMGYLYSA